MGYTGFRSFVKVNASRDAATMEVVKANNSLRAPLDLAAVPGLDHGGPPTTPKHVPLQD